jgi:hypothetical protein
MSHRGEGVSGQCGGDVPEHGAEGLGWGGREHRAGAGDGGEGWSSAVTEGRTGASPHPTAPLESSTRTATLETASRREVAMVKGAASGRASAAATSTEKVSLSSNRLM